jgi:hypothetical protein
VGLVALVGAWFLAYLTITYVPKLINPVPPVAVGVGQAAFVGTPYTGSQIGAVVSLAGVVAIAGVLVAGGIVFPARRRDHVAAGLSDESKSAGKPANGPRPTRALWIGIAVLAFLIVPDLRSTLQHSGDPASYVGSDGWDLSNVITWQMFVQLGLVPMRDFFYPYGFQWLYQLRTIGPAVEWVAAVVTLAIAGWSVWRLSGGKTARTITCLIALLLIGIGTIGAWRYVPALLVGTTYAAVGPLRHSRLVREHLMVVAASLLALFMGADVLGIGIVGLVMMLAGEIIGGRIKGRPARLVAAAAADAVPVAVAVGLIVLVWLAMGTASGNLRFLGDVSAVSSSDALDQLGFGPAGLLHVAPSAYSLFAALPALLGALGLMWARDKRATEPDVAPILLAASGVTLMLLLKEFVRPLGDEMLIAPLVALAWTAILTWRADSIRRAAFSSAALVALYLPLTDMNQPGFADFPSTAINSPIHAVRSLSVAFDSGLRNRAVRAFFDPTRFHNFPDVKIAFDYVLATHGSQLPSFAVVGDSQLTYPLLRQLPPYQTELYDSSPIAEQNAMLARLQRTRPHYVIWRKGFAIDDIPYTVRDPLIFRWMIENYVPVTGKASYEILRRRLPGEDIAREFWRGQLAGLEDLAFIPSYSTATSSRPCLGGNGCVYYAIVRGDPRRGSPIVQLSFDTDGVSYLLSLHARPGVHAYPVRLDRLWFWPLVGSATVVRSLTPGFTATISGLRSGDNLY